MEGREVERTNVHKLPTSKWMTSPKMTYSPTKVYPRVFQKKEHKYRSPLSKISRSTHRYRLTSTLYTLYNTTFKRFHLRLIFVNKREAKQESPRISETFPQTFPSIGGHPSREFEFTKSSLFHYKSGERIAIKSRNFQILILEILPQRAKCYSKRTSNPSNCSKEIKREKERHVYSLE